MAYAHVMALRFQYPRLISRLTSSAILERHAPALRKAGATIAKAAGSASLPPLLGMSGAVYAAITYSALASRDITFDFLGILSVSRSWLLAAVILFDIAGIAFKWR